MSATAPVVAAGLVGGYAAARWSGRRELGGAVLAAAGVVAGRSWARSAGLPTTAALTATYLGAFGASHALAKKVGAWPSVAIVTAAASGAAYVWGDRKG
jgi:hypothetical protein